MAPMMNLFSSITVFMIWICTTVAQDKNPIFKVKTDLGQKLNVKQEMSKASTVLKDIFKVPKNQAQSISSVCPSDSEIDCTGACVLRGRMEFLNKKPKGCGTMCVRKDYDPLACDGKCYPQGLTRPHQIGVDEKHPKGHCLMPGKTIPKNVLDDCMVFWGDATSCKDCKGVVGGNAMKDACGICEGKADKCGVKITQVMPMVFIGGNEVKILAGTDGAQLADIKCEFSVFHQVVLKSPSSVNQMGLVRCPTPKVAGKWNLTLVISKSVLAARAKFDKEITVLATNSLKPEKLMKSQFTPTDGISQALVMKMPASFEMPTEQMMCLIKGLDEKATDIRQTPARVDPGNKIVTCEVDELKDGDRSGKVALSLDEGSLTVGEWMDFYVLPKVPMPSIMPVSATEFYVNFDEDVDVAHMKSKKCVDLFEPTVHSKCKLGNNPICEFVNSRQMNLKVDPKLPSGCKHGLGLNDKLNFRLGTIFMPGDSKKKNLPAVILDFSKIRDNPEMERKMMPRKFRLQGPKMIRNCGVAKFRTEAMQSGQTLKWSLKKNEVAVDITKFKSKATTPPSELELDLSKFAPGDKMVLKLEAETPLGLTTSSHEFEVTKEDIPLVDIVPSQNMDNVDPSQGLLLQTKPWIHACNEKAKQALMDKKIMYKWSLVNKNNGKLIKELGIENELFIEPNVFRTQDAHIKLESWYEGNTKKSSVILPARPRKQMKLKKALGDRLIISKQSNVPLKLNADQMINDRKVGSINVDSAVDNIPGFRWSCLGLIIDDSVARMMRDNAMAGMTKMKGGLENLKNFKLWGDRSRKKRAANGDEMMRMQHGPPSALTELLDDAMMKPSPCYDIESKIYPGPTQVGKSELVLNPKKMPSGFYQIRLEMLMPDGSRMAERRFEIEVVDENLPLVRFLPTSKGRPSGDKAFTVRAQIDQCGLEAPPTREDIIIKTLSPRMMTDPCMDMKKKSKTSGNKKGDKSRNKRSPLDKLEGLMSGDGGEMRDMMESVKNMFNSAEVNEMWDNVENVDIDMHKSKMKETKNMMKKMMRKYPGTDDQVNPRIMDEIDLNDAMNTEGGLNFNSKLTAAGCYKTTITQVIRKGVLLPNREYAFAICARDKASGLVAENVMQIATSSMVTKASVQAPQKCTALEKIHLSVPTIEGISEDALNEATYEFGTVVNDKSGLNFNGMTVPGPQPSAYLTCLSNIGAKKVRYGVRICMENGDSCRIFSSAIETTIEEQKLTDAIFKKKISDIEKKAKNMGPSFDSLSELKSIRDYAEISKTEAKGVEAKKAFGNMVETSETKMLTMVKDAVNSQHMNTDRMTQISKMLENVKSRASGDNKKTMEEISLKMTESLNQNILRGDVADMKPKDIEALTNIMSDLPPAELLKQKDSLRMIDLSQLEVGAGPREIKNFGGKIRGRIRKDMLKGKSFKSSVHGSIVKFPDKLADAIGVCGIETTEVLKADKQIFLDAKENAEMASDFLEVVLRDAATGSEIAVTEAGDWISMSIPVTLKSGKKPVCATVKDRKISKSGMKTGNMQSDMRLDCFSTHLSTFLAVQEDDPNGGSQQQTGNNKNNNLGTGNKKGENTGVNVEPSNVPFLLLLFLAMKFLWN